MRTTLKRGVGRAAAVNGNGRAVLPPGTVTPVARYRQPPRAGALRLLGKAVLWLLALVAMVACALVGGFYLWAHESVAATQAHSRDVKLAQAQLDAVPLPGNPAVALVIGYDHRPNDGEASRSDTIMLIRADPATKTLSLLSFPRDLQVPIKCPHAQYPTRINAAYMECGSSGTLNTVRDLTGIPINYLISVNFRGFRQIIDQLGGVWLDIDRRYYNKNVGTYETAFADINLMPGYQKLNGWNALSFVRFRHTDNDLFRVARQQAFMKAFRAQIADSVGITDLVGIVNTISHNVEVGAGGGKPVPLSVIRSYAKFAYRMPPGNLFQVRIEGLYETGPARAELATEYSNIQAAVRQFMNPDVDAPDKAAAVEGVRKFKPKSGPKPASVLISVLNGNGVPGAATTTAGLLQQRGYRIAGPPGELSADAPGGWNYPQTLVYYDARQPRSELAARDVGRLFGVSTASPLPLRGRLRLLANGAMVVVIVGKTFQGTLATPAETTPKREPANVRPDRTAALPYIRWAQRRVPFQLQLPTVLERHSNPDVGYRSMPVRLYEVEGHKALRLVFDTGRPGEYWGIQQTDWEDAPILSDRNFRQKLRDGRTYDFYYSGSRLHMVVLRANGASYWVVNTLDNKLSNATMIAIAKGLRPFGKKR